MKPLKIQTTTGIHLVPVEIYTLAHSYRRAYNERRRFGIGMSAGDFIKQQMQDIDPAYHGFIREVILHGLS